MRLMWPFERFPPTRRGSGELLLLACLVGGLSPCRQASAAEATADDDSAARFLVEYRKHAPRLQEATSNIRCEYRFSKTQPDGSVEELGGTMFAKGQSWQFVQANASSSRYSGIVLSSSPAIRFQLRQPSKEGPYEVAAVNRSADAAGNEQIQAGISLNAEPFVNAAFQIFDLSIPKTLDDRDTRFSVRPASRDGSEYVELALAFPNSTNKRTARALLDPALDYAVSEYELAFTLPGEKGVRIVRRGEVKCERLEGGFVVPKRVRMEATSPISGKPVTRVATLEFVKITRGEVPDDQFTLQAFGIPELPTRQTRRLYPFDRWYFWLLVATGLGAWLYLRRARKRCEEEGGSPA